MVNQNNGNAQLNSIRNDYNDRVSALLNLGNTSRVYWNDRRRFRAI
jgi:hypothetical protein